MRYSPGRGPDSDGVGSAADRHPLGERPRRDGVVPGSLHIPRTVLEWRADLDKPWRSPHVNGFERQIILLCDHGCSTILGAATLVELGYSNAGDVIGGSPSWREAGFPVTSAPRTPPIRPASREMQRCGTTEPKRGAPSARVYGPRGMEMSVDVGIDVGLLKSEIRKTYASVSQEPEKDFIFPTGRAWAEDLGYPDGGGASVPDSWSSRSRAWQIHARLAE